METGSRLGCHVPCGNPLREALRKWRPAATGVVLLSPGCSSHLITFATPEDRGRRSHEVASHWQEARARESRGDRWISPGWLSSPIVSASLMVYPAGSRSRRSSHHQGGGYYPAAGGARSSARAPGVVLRPQAEPALAPRNDLAVDAQGVLPPRRGHRGRAHVEGATRWFRRSSVAAADRTRARRSGWSSWRRGSRRPIAQHGFWRGLVPPMLLLLGFVSRTHLQTARAQLGGAAVRDRLHDVLPLRRAAVTSPSPSGWGASRWSADWRRTITSSNGSARFSTSCCTASSTPRRRLPDRPVPHRHRLGRHLRPRAGAGFRSCCRFRTRTPTSSSPSSAGSSALVGRPAARRLRTFPLAGLRVGALRPAASACSPAGSPSSSGSTRSPISWSRRVSLPPRVCRCRSCHCGGSALP